MNLMYAFLSHRTQTGLQRGAGSHFGAGASGAVVGIGIGTSVLTQAVGGVGDVQFVSFCRMIAVFRQRCSAALTGRRGFMLPITRGCALNSGFLQPEGELTHRPMAGCMVIGIGNCDRSARCQSFPFRFRQGAFHGIAQIEDRIFQSVCIRSR